MEVPNPLPPTGARRTQLSQELACDLCAELQRVLERPFTPWRKHEAWQPYSDVSGEVRPVLPKELPIQSLLAQSALGCAAHTLALEDDRQLLVVPIDPGATDRWVACGIVSGHSPALLRQLADYALHNRRQAQDLVDARVRVGHYIDQITTDFEELTWLGSISRHFQVCDPANDLTHVAESVIPALRQLIHATDAFLFTARGPARAASGQSPSGELLFHNGVRSLTEDDAKQVVDAWHRDCAERPLVRNQCSLDPQCPAPGKLRNCILVRVATQNHHLGWLLVANRGSHIYFDSERPTNACVLNDSDFGTFEASLVGTTAGLLATHGRNMDLLQQKEHLFIGVVRALINAVDAKDAYTYGHSDRVAAMSRCIARRMQLSERECEQLFMAGLLHDIGKIGIPDSVLGKDGKLTDEEFAIIKKHPEIGVAILKHLDPLTYVLPGVLHHHESYNGSGYPHGLAGEEIPLFGRIIAVADAYDAMTSNRPYRRGMPTEKAESILRAGMQQQWDGQVVRAFFEGLSDAYEICGFGQTASMKSPPQLPVGAQAAEAIRWPAVAGPA